MKDLKRCRKEIDEIDSQIMAFFEKRMNIAKDVVTYKLTHHLEIFQASREQEVIEKNVNRIDKEELKPFASLFVRDIMNISKSYQATYVPIKHKYDLKKPTIQDIIVGFAGVTGSFTEQAAQTYFGDEIERQSYEDFDDVFQALKNNQIHYGVVPLENSSTGAINDNYDAIRDYGFFIVGQQSLSISQHLLGLPEAKREDLREVYSHPQGLLQTSNFLSQFPHIKTKEFVNTASAAKYVSLQNNIHYGAIASANAAQIYGLKIIEENIQNVKSNSTRFIIFGKHLETNQDVSCVSLVFTLNHQVGALYQVMKVMNDYQINMLRIESRPLKDTPWEYYFYVDLEGQIDNYNIARALEDIKAHTNTLRVLGNYAKR